MDRACLVDEAWRGPPILGLSLQTAGLRLAVATAARLFLPLVGHGQLQPDKELEWPDLREVLVTYQPRQPEKSLFEASYSMDGSQLALCHGNRITFLFAFNLNPARTVDYTEQVPHSPKNISSPLIVISCI